jgi:FKBP-type peptidyl-prolyl cis-trans isomerase 2
MVRTLRRDPDGLSTIGQIIAMLVVIAVLVGLFLLLYVQRPPPAGAPRRIEAGDIVAVGYTGTFADTGRVFDTSFRRVGEDNVSYPKAASFTWRAAWNSLVITPVGAGKVIKGFDEGIIGLAVGESKRIVVPPEKGYGSPDPARIFERPLLQEVPARVVMNETAFSDKYGTTAADGLIVRDPFWGWNATASVSNHVVTVTNSPFLEERVRPYGAWDARVTAIDDAANEGTGIVYVRHALTADDAGNIRARDGPQEFFVSSVDPVRDVYVANYNPEVVGRTLIFDVTVESITRF